MRPRPSAILGTALGLGLVSLGPSRALADPARYIPVLEQRAAILDCRYEMGIRGPARFGAEWPEIPPGGQTITWILPGQGLGPEQTDRINECADQRLGRAPTPRFATGAPQAKPEAYGTCPRHAPVLFGGSTYCIKRR
jgi:hypothetical protein